MITSASQTVSHVVPCSDKEGVPAPAPEVMSSIVHVALMIDLLPEFLSLALFDALAESATSQEYPRWRAPQNHAGFKLDSDR